MRHLLPTLLVGLSLAASAPAHAQAPDWVNQLLTAARLPLETRDARREGVTNDEIRSVLEAMRRNRVPAYEAVAVIDTARAVRREHGPVDNFGAFVQAQLASGKRGRDLAAAIRAEHARMGRGNAARGRDDASARGRPEAQERKPDAREDRKDRKDSAARTTPANRPGNRPGNKPDDRGRGNAGRPQ